MKVCVLQPKYSFNESDLQLCFDGNNEDPLSIVKRAIKLGAKKFSV